LPEITGLKEAASIRRTAHGVLRGLGLVYAIAFVSLGVQVLGLVGSNGISPVVNFLPRTEAHFGSMRFYWIPTVFWANASDLAITLAWCVGAALGTAVLVGKLHHPAVMALLWFLYLSFCTVGGGFLNFQWDALLLEAGLVGVFLVRADGSASRMGLWLMRILLVKLMVLSGLVKLLSGDPSWLNGTALDFHFLTQPLPGPLSPAFHQAPAWVRETGIWFTWLVELGLPWLAFAPGRGRLVFGAGTLLFMGFISASGNYGFFNLLTCVLCISLLEDGQLPKPKKPVIVPEREGEGGLTRLFAVVSLSLSGVLSARTVLGVGWVPDPVQEVLVAVSPLRSVNSYGLFRVMTKGRPELLLEVTTDGQNWHVWPNRWKPWNPEVGPRWAHVHMPRLDWQLWFAALRPPNRRPAWVDSFLARVLEHREPVMDLLGPSPIPGGRPMAVRIRVEEFGFAAPVWRDQTGEIWTHEPLGRYTPEMGIR
jgi:hypothetical protein